MKKFLIPVLGIAAVSVFAALEPMALDGKLWDNVQIGPTSRIVIEEVGTGFQVNSWGVDIAVYDHWNNRNLQVVRASYYRPKGGSDMLGNAVVKRDTQLILTIEQYSDHAMLEVKNKNTGLVLVYAPFVVRGDMTQQNFLTIKGKPDLVKRFQLEENIPDKPDLEKEPVAPEGYTTIFSDHFRGVTEKWGVRRTTPGVMSIQKKTYFTYSYPILLPGLKLDDGIIAFDVMMQDDTIGAIRFRTSELGDDYYTFTFRGSPKRGFSGFFRYLDGEETRLGRGSKIDEKGRVHFEIKLDGSNMVVTANGRIVDQAYDETFRSGGIYLCGCHESVVQFFSFDVFAKEGSQAKWAPVKEVKTETVSSVKELPLPAEAEMKGAEIFVDAQGKTHYWRVDKQFLWYDGHPYVPMSGSDGQYFLLYEPDAVSDVNVFVRVRDVKTLADIRKYGLTWQGVFLRLVDYIDPAKTDHAFSEDNGIGGRSRLETIAGDTFRVTSPRKSLLPYFSYTTSFRKAHKMHIVSVLVPNDVERYLGVYPLPNESGSFGVATGRTFPLDNKNYFAYACYYPRATKTEWIFLNNTFSPQVKRGNTWPKNGGGAIGGFWVMEPIGDKADYFPKTTPPEQGPERTIGDYNQRPNFILSNFGVEGDMKSKTPEASEKRVEAFSSWLDHVRFAGCNDAQVCWFGTDWLIHGSSNNNIGFDTELFKKYKVYAYDYVTELCPELEKRGMTTVASTATYNIDDFVKPEYGFTDEDIRIGPDGEPQHSFGTKKLEPTTPHVQNFYCTIIKELAEKAKDAPGVRGIAISLDGFFTFEGGWGEYPLKRFERECGVKLPDYTAVNAHTYITNDVERLTKWRHWRARDAHQTLCRLRDTIREVNPEWTLVVRLMTTYSYTFNAAESSDQRALLLKVGINPDLYRDEEGIVFAPRTFYEAKVTKQPGEWSFEYDHGVMDVPTKFGTAHHQWTGYWESPGMFPAGSKFSYGWLGCPNTIPVGRQMLETFTYHLANENVRMWTYQAWESALQGTQHLLRRMATAYRALPVAEPTDFSDEVTVTAGDLTPDDFKIAWYGDRFALINTTGRSGTVSVKTGGDVLELGRGRTYEASFFARRTAIEVEPYDLLVFKKMK